MECREAKGKLVAYVDGQLSGADRETIGEHIPHCSMCQQEVKEWEKLSFVLGQYPEAKVSSDFVPRFWEKVQEQETVYRRQNLFFYRFAAATVALSLFLGIIGARLTMHNVNTEQLSAAVRIDYNMRDYSPDSLSRVVIYNESKE